MNLQPGFFIFLIGLLSFLLLHSVRIIAPGWRQAKITAWGEQRYKGIYSLLSIATFILLIWGYGQARMAPSLVWVPPAGLKHLAALLTLPAFIFLIAAYVPNNHIKAKLKHPMVLGIKLWALAHLLIGMWLHSILLFAGFLVWAVLDFRSARRRAEQPAASAPQLSATLIALVVGIAAWAGFALYAHAKLIGVAPFGM